MAHDILILGGGPAGLSTALHLDRLAPDLAPRVLILEKAHYPRAKLCAGGLVIDAEIILERLGLDVSEIPHVDVDAAHFDFETRGLGIRMPGRHTLRVIRRDEFDHWLAGKVRERGIEIQEGVTVRNVRTNGNEVTVETDQGSFIAQAIVGADGSNGVTRRCVLPDAPIHTARALEVLAPPHDTPPGEDIPQHVREKRSAVHQQRQAYFDFFPVPVGIAGYTWDFPTQVNGRPMRCWGVYDTNLLADMRRPQLKKPLADEMRRHGFDLEKIELKGHPIRWFSPRHPMSAPRVLLAGDAVGADGIFGEGISMALGYGALAAQELAEAFERNDFSFRGYRNRVLHSPLGQALSARWLITRILYRLHWAWFQEFFWRYFKPVIVAAAWIFVLNWGKRMPDIRRRAPTTGRA